MRIETLQINYAAPLKTECSRSSSFAVIWHRDRYSIPATTLQSTIAHLQRVQNAAARLVCGLGPRDHVTKSQRELHCLPIRFHIVYKLCLMMHNVHTGFSPG